MKRAIILSLFFHSHVTATQPRLDFPVSRFLLKGDGNSVGHDQKEQKDNQSCDQSFQSCLSNKKCVDCFETLEMKRIDWASVPEGTSCQQVVQILTKARQCTSLQGDKEAIETFCSTYDACTSWTSNPNNNQVHDDDDDDEGVDGSKIDCSTLTECNWPGMRPAFLGDGICHNNIAGCYNTEVCRYDGGDCCEDTCHGDFAYVECGHDGFACKDPSSELCDPTLSPKCRNISGLETKDNTADPSSVTCGADETKYRLIMYDSFGNGWGTTTLNLSVSNNQRRTKFIGSLQDGSMGTSYICLSKSMPTCYTITVSGGGKWGKNISWEIKSMGEGSPAIARGGGPSMTCQFGVAGSPCENTCTGISSFRTIETNDSEYQSYKDMERCISEKCIIQLGICQEDPLCKSCLAEDSQEYCFNIDTFNAIADCTICKCTEHAESNHCHQKSRPGLVPSSKSLQQQVTSGGAPVECSPAQTMQGANAVIGFSKCSDIDQIAMTVTEFDTNNFGALNVFEACARAYNAHTSNHGGHTALGCMQILVNAIEHPYGGIPNSHAPPGEISAIAQKLYYNGESFCDCAKISSQTCPQCNAFTSFKTLLHEALDACESLDKIDCDAWNEFYMHCKSTMWEDFLTVDFTNENQCRYVERGCSGSGVFPAFRKLDCQGEIPSEAWDFYKQYSSNCIGRPNSSPISTPSVQATTSTSNNKAYESTNGSTASTRGGNWHSLKILFCVSVFALGCYSYYRHRTNQFDFVQYRRARNFDYHYNDEYLQMENSNYLDTMRLSAPHLQQVRPVMNEDMT
jgi:hypothetical protein